MFAQFPSSLSFVTTSTRVRSGPAQTWCSGRKPDEPFNPKAIADPAKRAWAAVNEREREEAEQKGRNPDLLPSFTFHECRHTFASLLIDAGVNPKAIQEFMGHATIEETFSRYGHLMPGARDQAHELVDAYMTAAHSALIARR